MTSSDTGDVPKIPLFDELCFSSVRKPVDDYADLVATRVCEKMTNLGPCNSAALPEKVKDFKELITDIKDTLNSAWAEIFTELGFSFKPCELVFDDETSNIGEGVTTFPFYRDGKVYVSSSFLKGICEDIYEGASNHSIFLMMCHEWGHHIQSIKNIFGGGIITIPIFGVTTLVGIVERIEKRVVSEKVESNIPFVYLSERVTSILEIKKIAYAYSPDSGHKAVQISEQHADLLAGFIIQYVHKQRGNLSEEAIREFFKTIARAGDDIRNFNEIKGDVALYTHGSHGTRINALEAGLLENDFGVLSVSDLCSIFSDQGINTPPGYQVDILQKK